jgi:hypothetical protein
VDPEGLEPSTSRL